MRSMIRVALVLAGLCSFMTGCLDGTPPVPLGAPCTADDICEEGAVCDEERSLCVPAPCADAGTDAICAQIGVTDGGVTIEITIR